MKKKCVRKITISNLWKPFNDGITIIFSTSTLNMKTLKFEKN